ncbi:hypothetical protein [Emticicia sp. 17c]|uniref:hypothetical protein n=1 Tax=Emticicia sp. 17c TaxID=3127704 RepID=UPI00301E1E18
MKKIIICLLMGVSFNLYSQNIKEIKFGKYIEPIKVLKPEEFSIEGTWEIVHREWEFDCEKEYKIGDTLDYDPPYSIMQDYMHLGELVHFDKNSIRTYSSIMATQSPFIRFRKGYWNLQEYAYYVSGPKECKGQYYLNRFGEKQLVIEADCFFRSNELILETVNSKSWGTYRQPKEGMSSYYYFVLNEDLMVRLTSFSIIYLKRSNKPLHFPIDKDNYYVITGNGRDIGFDLNIANNEFKPDNYMKIVYPENLVKKDSKPFTIDNYTKFSCENLERGLPDLKLIYGNTFVGKDGKTYGSAPDVTESGNRIYIPFKELNKNILDIFIKKRVKKHELWQLRYKVLKPVLKRINKKTYIYKEPNNEKTIMYLIKGDKTKVIDEEKDWYYIEFNGEKMIRGWIKKSDVGAN